MHNDWQFPLDAAFSPQLRAALAAAPGTVWATDLSVSTCVGMLWAVEEAFLVGAPLYDGTMRSTIEVREETRDVARRVLAVFAEEPRRDAIRPPDDVGFSREFLRAWGEQRVDLYKHVQWAAHLTADSLPALLAALDRCPAPAPDPAIYFVNPLARTVTAQACISEIVDGARMQCREIVARIQQAIERAHDVTRVIRALKDALRPRCHRVLRRELSPGEAMSLLFGGWDHYRGMDVAAFMAKLHADSARLLAMTDAELAARVRARS